MVFSSFSQTAPFKLRTGKHWFDRKMWRWLNLFICFSFAGQSSFIRRSRALGDLGQSSIDEYSTITQQHPELANSRPSDGTISLYFDLSDLDMRASGYTTEPTEPGSKNLVEFIKGPDTGREVQSNWIPALDDQTKSRLAGAIYTKIDTSGNCATFTQKLKKICETQFGVQFKFNEYVNGVYHDEGKILEIQTDLGNTYTADKYLVATGASVALLEVLGVKMPICPVKGFTLDVPLKPEFVHSNHLPLASVTDDDSKLYSSLVGNSLRISGYAEIAGFNRDLRQDREQQILKFVKSIASADELDLEKRRYYCCHRPVSPDDLPLLGQVEAFQNLYVNLGHGSMGWTIALGSAVIVAHAMATKIHDVRFDPNRFEKISNWRVIRNIFSWRDSTDC